ncbi:glycoside hydrolase family 5 protein [Spirillospora sp. CA-142024]|uniref:glycoside hydrolase family 5 protein n=1 Tax=Spirillospora sp. CA-142024 TaxID=3240036 RepID=UPI003D8BA468
MRRLVRLLAATTLTIGTLGAGTAYAVSRQAPAERSATPAAAPAGKLRATPQQAFVGSQGPEQLKGPNLQPVWDPDGTDTWGEGTYTAISAKGFTSVRFVLFWDDFEPSKGVWNENAFTTLTTALRRAKAAGLYVVFDGVHLYGQPEGQSRVPEWARTADGMGAVAANGLGYLQQLATRYGANTEFADTVAAYDPVNEPYRWPVDHRSVLADYTKIINAIRTKDSATPIMVEPTYGDARVPDADLAALTPTDRSNLIWSVHDYYAGNDGVGYGDDDVAISPNPSDGTTGYDPADKANLAAHLQVQLDTASKAGMPLWIGEFGIGSGAAGHDGYIRDKVALYKSKGLGYAWWEYYDDGTFSMVDENDAWNAWVNLLL